MVKGFSKQFGPLLPLPGKGWTRPMNCWMCPSILKPALKRQEDSDSSRPTATVIDPGLRAWFRGSLPWSCPSRYLEPPAKDVYARPLTVARSRNRGAGRAPSSPPASRSGPIRRSAVSRERRLSIPSCRPRLWPSAGSEHAVRSARAGQRPQWQRARAR